MKSAPQSSLLHPNARTFDEQVLRSDQPVLVDFYAPWCAPCMMLKPELERLAVLLQGRARVAVINVDEEPQLADMFEVSSIPALMVVKDGRRVETWTGFAPCAAMMERMQRHLG